MIRRQLQSLITVARAHAAHALNLTALLSFGVVLATTSAAQGRENQPTAPTFASIPTFDSIKLAAIDAVPLPRPSGQQLANGTYLFGEASQRDQVGRAYMVFEVTGKTVVGAVYWPQSSFNCFEGRFHRNQLSLRVTETYSKEVYSHAIALAPETSVLASNDLMSPPLEFGLEGMHRLEQLNDNDQRILTACQPL